MVPGLLRIDPQTGQQYRPIVVPILLNSLWVGSVGRAGFMDKLGYKARVGKVVKGRLGYYSDVQFNLYMGANKVLPYLTLPLQHLCRLYQASVDAVDY